MSGLSHNWKSYREIIDDAAIQIQDVAKHNFPPKVLAGWAGDGCEDFAERTSLAEKSILQPMVSAQRLYRNPHDLLKVSRVAVKTLGNPGLRELVFVDEDDLMDDNATTIEGDPDLWYPTEDKEQFGIYPFPSTGGFVGDTTSAGSTLTLICTGLLATDDIYNGMEVEIMDGPLQGETSTVSDYDGTTKTVTVDVAFTGTVGSGVRFTIDGESMQLDYIASGNKPLRSNPSLAVAAAPVPTYSQFAAVTAQRMKDHHKGCEAYFTSGDLKGTATKVIGSNIVTGTPTATTLTVWPELPARPAATDTFELSQIPNIPGSFHIRLVDYVVFRALAILGRPLAAERQNAYESGIVEAIRTADPETDQEFQRIEEFGKEERNW